MKKIALIIGLLFMAGLAQAEAPGCGLNTQGGVDIFPWSLAQPFPWDTIQGLWKVSDSPDQVIRMRVVRQDQNVKHLSVDVLSRKHCVGPLMKGHGIITAAEKNVVRLSLVDKQGITRLMKLAVFNTNDLQMDSNLCGQKVLAASVIDIENDYDSADDLSNGLESNMMLKKITNSTDFYCRKRKN